jgi:hypothetical protein
MSRPQIPPSPSAVRLETCLQLALWLDARFGAETHADCAPSDRLGMHAGRLIAQELVEATTQPQGMVDVFAAMHSCIDNWLSISPVPNNERRLIKRRAVRAGVIQCWKVAAELRPDEPSYLERIEETCAAVLVAELAEDQLGT